MADPITLGMMMAGSSLLGSLMSSNATSSAASTQAGAAQTGIEEQRRQFDEMRKLLSPYMAAGQGALGQYAPYQQAGAGALPSLQQYSQAGQSALDQQMALLGMAPEAINPPMQVSQPPGGGMGGGMGLFGGAMGALGGLGGLGGGLLGQPGQDQAGQGQAGPSMRYVGGQAGQDAQRAAIERISGGEQFKALAQQGEEAMLQRASATGGLRGGNIQGALAQFRPQLLNQLIEQQYGRLGGLATQGGNVAQNLASSGLSATGELARIGQASAAGTGAAGQQTGANIATLMGQQGAAQAGGQLAGAAPFANLLGMPLQMAGMNYGRTGQFGLPGFGGLFGGGSGGGSSFMNAYNNSSFTPMQPGGGY